MEHAPPKCLFPERKDVTTNTDYRKNLITVPSCEAHNTATSRDDEYLLYVLSSSITSSDVGINQFLTKVKRAAERSPALASALLVDNSPVQLLREDSQKWEDAYALGIQGSRLDSVFIKNAYALYFHETGKKFSGRISVVTGFTLYNDQVLNSGIEMAINACEEFFANHANKGDNPDVFYYRFEEGAETATMLMNFYGSSKVIVQFNKH